VHLGRRDDLFFKQTSLAYAGILPQLTSLVIEDHYRQVTSRHLVDILLKLKALKHLSVDTAYSALPALFDPRVTIELLSLHITSDKLDSATGLLPDFVKMARGTSSGSKVESIVVYGSRQGCQRVNPSVDLDGFKWCRAEERCSMEEFDGTFTEAKCE